jgi:hypothetical protein
MGNNLRWHSDNLCREIAPVVTSEAAGFEARHLTDGLLHTRWRATSTATQTLTYDAGSGNTRRSNAVIIGRADLLVAATATVVVQWSNDGATGWTNAFTPVALSSGDLLGPTATHYVKEYSLLDKRAHRLQLSTLTQIPEFVELLIGEFVEAPRNPRLGAMVGAARAHRGADLELEWGWLTEAQAVSLADYLTDVTPYHPMEQPVETVAGTIYGALPHWISDPLGAVFRQSNTPQLYPVLCVSGADLGLTIQGPAGTIQGVRVRYRQRV